ncbi:MAG: molecular chaperone DnaJ [delta proteobacterium MLS_D]|jgi:molecular chaperone DnaJ|nr:MAG: molecular chaperone DnaJ [delta proteobacterium MLS_D]
MAQDLYSILGLKRNASEADIKKAYRKLARKYHPDVNPGNKDAEQKFKDISRAYEYLGNPEKRKLYDEFGEESLQAGFDADKTRQYHRWQSAADGEGGFGVGDDYSGTEFGRFHSYEDIFGDMFGFSAAGRSAGRPAKERGQDVEYTLSIDFLSALKGMKTDISLRRVRECEKCSGTGTEPGSKLIPCNVCGGSGRIKVAEGPLHFTQVCPRCGGHGRVGTPCSACGGSGQTEGTEKIRVSIPPGVDEGSRIRVAGKGGAGRAGGSPGDLYLVVHVEPHPVLSRKGSDLYMDVPVSVGEAVGGGTITIPTVDGDISLKIPSGSQNGKLLRVKGKGMADPRTKTRGDLFVRLAVRLPEGGDEEMRSAARILDRYYQGDIRKNVRL